MSFTPDYTQPSYAFMRHAEHGFIWGQGPFTSSSEPPENETAFYVNTFDLSDPQPWKIPTETHILPHPPSITRQAINIEWQAPQSDLFAEVLQDILQHIQSGELIKSVPALPETGLAAPCDIHELFRRCTQAPPYLIPYGYRESAYGFCGATPEMLFHQQGNHITTMALAGTARPEDAHVFINDPKEIHEHEIVVQAILLSLEPYGHITRAPRSIRHLGSLIHLQSGITLDAEQNHPPDFWLNKLHPTPALGSAPRTSETVALLQQWREKLQCPAYFGSPFGVWHHQSFTALVSIRGIQYRENRLCLTAGCGVVSGSSLLHEWRELALKRQAIKNLFL